MEESPSGEAYISAHIQETSSTLWKQISWPLCKLKAKYSTVFMETPPIIKTLNQSNYGVYDWIRTYIIMCKGLSYFFTIFSLNMSHIYPIYDVPSHFRELNEENYKQTQNVLIES